jgi:Tfp pilus assembly protein PilE
MLGRRYQIASLQSHFYRNQFRRFVRFLMIELVMIVLLVFAILYYAVFPSPQRYYANTTDGQILDFIGVAVQPS